MNAPSLQIIPRDPCTPYVTLTEEDALYALLWQVYARGGFGAVVKLCAVTQKKLAHNNLADVTAEGWIV